MAVEIVADSVICGVEVSQVERIEQSCDKQTNKQTRHIIYLDIARFLYNSLSKSSNYKL